MTLRSIISAKRTISACFFALLLISTLSAVSLRAQESAASPSQQESIDSVRQAAPGTQKEASEEKENDQTEKFKHSSSVRLIGRILGLDSQRSYWISVIINFAIIAMIIFWAGRKSLPEFFRNRTATIQKAMQEAQKASEEARRRLADIESRLSRLDADIAAMRDAAEKEAAAEESRIQSAAVEDAMKIVAAAEQEIAAAVKAARRQLTAHAADLAIGLAQKQIRVDTATDQALVRNFVTQLGAGSDHSGKDRN